MQAFYDSKPSKYEAVGNGSYLYRWNITEETIESPMGESEETETRTQWRCEEVTVWPPVSSAAVTRAVIAETWDSDYEQKLVNEYNSALLGLYGGSKSSAAAKAKIQAYTDFLTGREALKATVDADCAELGIV